MSWWKTIFGGDASKAQLADKWNVKGRAYFAAASDAVANHYRSGAPVEIDEDPRDLATAKAVIAEVMALNKKGQWQDARRNFDPAHEPFIPLLDKQGQNLSCVTVIGPDTAVLRLGSSYQDGDSLLIRDGTVTPLPGVLAIAASPNHEWLIVIKDDGFHLRSDLNAPDRAVLIWPCPSGRLDRVCLSDDGRRVAFGDEEHGIFVGDFVLGRWTKLHPNAAYLAEIEEEDEDTWSGAMLNFDLSPDGKYVAYGEQSYGHIVVRIDADLNPEPWCKVGPEIDYPHFACFAGDGRHLALNGCHFYNGVTISVDVPASLGLDKPDYEADPRTPVINDMLRVYAATWLPPEALDWHEGSDGSGAFVLAGLSYLTAVTPAGKVLFYQYFGSSASSIDYCRQTRRLYLGSYSGMLHVYDISRDADVAETYGYRPRHEVYRWFFWKDHPPFRW